MIIARSIKQLLVKNIDINVKPHQIKEIFDRIGVVKEFSMPVDEDNIHKGYAYVEYSDPANCLKAEKKINNRRIFGKYVKGIVVVDDSEGTKLTHERLVPRTKYSEAKEQEIFYNYYN